MRAAAILGLGCSAKDLKPFQKDEQVEWRIGMPAAAHHAEIILLFGGDGTIHRHLSQLVKLALPVLVVPAGSGNDFARALGLRRLQDSLAAWRSFCAGQRDVRAIDLGVITPLDDAGDSPASGEHRHYFCSVAGVGLDAEVARRANILPRWLRGHGGYALTLAPMIFRFATFPMKILSSEGETWKPRSDRATMLAAFANTSTYGGGMKIAPNAKMDDSQLDVCVIGAIDPFKLFCMFPTIYLGRHIGLKTVGYFQASRLRLKTDSPLDVYADGEYVCHTPVEVSVEPGALKVLMP
jgi:diacylglycerol kinase (ATP)